jgi:hypothetical protein
MFGHSNPWQVTVSNDCVGELSSSFNACCGRYERKMQGTKTVIRQLTTAVDIAGCE